MLKMMETKNNDKGELIDPQGGTSILGGGLGPHIEFRGKI